MARHTLKTSVSVNESKNSAFNLIFDTQALKAEVFYNIRDTMFFNF